MNYREKKRKRPADKKLRKFSAFRKKYPGSEAEILADILCWEEQADQIISEKSLSGELIPHPGEQLYMTGWAGAAGTLFLAEQKKDRLSARFPAAFIHTAHDREVFGNFYGENADQQNLNPDFYTEKGASWIAPVGEGGLLKTLYRFGKETNLGFRVQSKKVPVRQITVEFCELFLLHPWELLTGRSFLFTAEHNAPLLRELEERGISVSEIGMVTGEKQKLICRGTEESNINRPEPDGILTLLLEEMHV